MVVKRRTPGEDGIPSEVWLRLWKVIGMPLFQFDQSSLEHRKNTPRAWSRGIVRMIPKDPTKELMGIGELRPITLLDCDYKVGTKLLGWRMRNVVAALVSKAQRGFMGGRDIRHNIILVQGLLQRDVDGLMIFVDWSKASTTRFEWRG